MLDKPKSTFPFCSDRCRLIDLGRWLDGKYQIPVDNDDESHGESQGGEPGDEPDDERSDRR
ncbi:MAG: DNA gyrase inhibitor YacG [Burkholderiales bacterium]|nr:DNA gyrase inhibitor YacG [Phycisphaerae bacterium]